MNLFFNPSISELRKLIRETDNEKEVHHIVVDYDGEVLIDPDLNQPEINLDRFKFRINLYERPKNFIRNKSRKLRDLLNNLLEGWEGNTNAGALN
jgi:hypothetical protein